MAALNGSSPAAGGGNGGGGGWANFPQNNKMQWMAANGAANGAANPFMVSIYNKGQHFFIQGGSLDKRKNS